MENNINQYSCDKVMFTFSEEIKNIKLVKDRYDAFISGMESFFNEQLDGPNDLNNFQGDVFELSDSSEKFFFPFKIQNNELHFAENESWRNIIMTAIVLTVLQEGIQK
jgi:hypothetical protein